MQALYQLSYSPLRCAALLEGFPRGDVDNITRSPRCFTKSFPGLPRTLRGHTADGASRPCQAVAKE